MQRLRSALAPVCLLCLLCLTPGAVHAGGYDTPIVYSARHIGMGGTAIGGVDDPSAVFHNPAGLSGVRGVGILADLSLLTGTLTTTGGFANSTVGDGLGDANESERIVAPLFMVAGGYQVIDDLRIGLAVYPVASGAAEYRTQFVGMDAIDKTRLVFFEASPALSYTLPGGLSLGLGYRVTYATLERVQGFADDPQVFDFELTGLDYTGVRAGLQWRPTKGVALGLVYRHRIDVEVTADEAVAAADVRDASTTLTLPGKLGVGARYDIGAFAFALDMELGFNSQNDVSVISGTRTDGVLGDDGNAKVEAVDNVFDWQDSVTARIGAQYLVAPAWPVRVGYIYDGQVSSKAYPSAFGTPPAASHSVTLGAGYLGNGWQVNFALARRSVSTSVAADDIGEDPACATCAPPGDDFSLELYGVYVDYSVDFGGEPAN